jgi:hypothetical protein
MLSVINKERMLKAAREKNDSMITREPSEINI